MGTRYEDQPPEHWAEPDSLDPTPVWKQFLLVGLFLVVGLVLTGFVAAFAIAPQIVTPPALVAGDRLVLSASDVPALGHPPKRIGAPLVNDSRSFWLGRASRTEIVALRTVWSPSPGGADCPVELVTRASFSYTATCGDMNAIPEFDSHGAAVAGARRGLDRYLVSMSDDRVIVNLSRLIVAPERLPSSPTP